jgi:hypothetical protein
LAVEAVLHITLPPHLLEPPQAALEALAISLLVEQVHLLLLILLVQVVVVVVLSLLALTLQAIQAEQAEMAVAEVAAHLSLEHLVLAVTA